MKEGLCKGRTKEDSQENKILAQHLSHVRQRNNQMRQRHASPGTFVGEAIRAAILIVITQDGLAVCARNGGSRLPEA